MHSYLILLSFSLSVLFRIKEIAFMSNYLYFISGIARPRPGFYAERLPPPRMWLPRPPFQGPRPFNPMHNFFQPRFFYQNPNFVDYVQDGKRKGDAPQSVTAKKLRLGHSEPDSTSNTVNSNLRSKAMVFEQKTA